MIHFDRAAFFYGRALCSPAVINGIWRELPLSPGVETNHHDGFFCPWVTCIPKTFEFIKYFWKFAGMEILPSVTHLIGESNH